MTTKITPELLKETLPRSLHGMATQDFADKVNGCVTDPLIAKEVRENFLSYGKVLLEGKFKTEDYLKAIVYVTHKLMGYSNRDSYVKTFPSRYQALMARGVDEKGLSSYVSLYHRNKLVTLLLEQAAVPFWLLNMDAYQRAINKQLELMNDPNCSSKVQQEAANSIMTHLKPPEVKKFEIDVGVKNDGGMDDIRAEMVKLAETQRKLIESGANVKQIAASKLANAEVIDAEFVEKDS